MSKNEFILKPEWSVMLQGALKKVKNPEKLIQKLCDGGFLSQLGDIFEGRSQIVNFDLYHDLARLYEIIGYQMDLSRDVDYSLRLRSIIEKLQWGAWKLSQSPNRWTVDLDGVIRFSVTGLGLSGPEMEKHLVAEGHKVSDSARKIVRSPDYVGCEKGKVYNLAALPGKLFSDNERTTENIRKEGDRRNLIHGENLPTEIGALIRLNFSNKEIEEMGLYWLVAMHEPVKDSDGDPRLLGANRDDDKSWLNAYWVMPGRLWYCEDGFVFGAPHSPLD